MKTSIPRLRSVRFKTGGEVRLLPAAPYPHHPGLEGVLPTLEDMRHGRVAAFGFCAVIRETGGYRTSFWTAGPQEASPWPQGFSA